MIFLPSIYCLSAKRFDSSVAVSFYVRPNHRLFIRKLNLADIMLVSGTLRSNLDPFNLHDDATLWDALKRSYLVEYTYRDSMITKEEATSHGGAHTPVSRFGLDTIIEDEGGNLSVGQVRLFQSSSKFSNDQFFL